ncbi:MAG: hypothetical protein NZ891_07945, partial [bacterium]|nr:hypothetical protein [bacterium]MDW8164652.1 hypothetical protein [Candidatus Omnitrophota bacterium]
MIEKIYKGKNFKKIIEKIKRELGDDAIVHSTKIIEQKYPLPFLKKKIFEIKASKNIESPQIIIREKIENFENEEKFPFLYDCRDLYDNLVENGIEPVLAKSMVINFSLKIS